MTEESIFTQALEKKTPEERAVFLREACGGDSSLLNRVEALLRSHTEAGVFLEKPAVVQMADTEAVTPPEGTQDVTVGPSKPGLDATEAEVSSPDVVPLDFLKPTEKPGSLGRLDHYEVLEVIGKGGFGVVLKAFDERLHRVVAVKVLSPAFAANGSARKRFSREAQAVAAIKNEHVVGIYDVKEDANPPYLVMECIDGVSLQQKIDKQGSLGVKEILRIGTQIAEGLAAAHKQGKVHRDIKPANILLENGVERVKITDFGLARAVDDASVTQSGTVAGTPMYMSPEQAEGLPIDHRSDLFSLGTVLYAMCTGHPPFRASGTHAVLKRVIDASPRPIREINNEIPDWLCEIVAKLHAKKPEDRFQTAKEVAELLGQHLAHLQQPASAPAPAPVVVPAQVLSTSTLEKLLEASDTSNRLLQLGGVLTAFALGTPGVLLLVLNPALLWLGISLLAAALVLGFVVSRIRQRWSVTYRGHRVRYDCGCFTGVWLFLDDVRVASGGVGFRTEIRGVIPDGEAAGETIVVLSDTGLLQVRCRIFVEHQTAAVAPVVSSPVLVKPPAVSRRRRLAVRLVLLGLAVLFLFVFGKSWWYFLINSSYLELRSDDPNIVKLVLKRDGRIVETLHGGFVMQSIAPGTYELEAECVLGRRVKQFRVGRTYLLYTESHTQEMANNRCTIPLRRGEVLSVRFESATGLLTPPKSNETGWVQLFNGEDLDGWKEHPRQFGAWTVENGLLVGRCDGSPQHLFSQRGDYEDFHVRAEVRLNDNGNSGLYFRAEFNLDLDGDFPTGYEAQIINIFPKTNFTPKTGVRRTGSLFDFENISEPLVKSGEWFTLDVIAQGRRIIIKVNDRLTVDYVDEKQTYRKGHFALQVAGPFPTVVQFKKITIKKLPPEEPRPTVIDTGHKGPVICGALSRDGKTLATGSFDGFVKLWDIETKKEQGALPVGGNVSSTSFSPEGTTLAVSGSGNLVLWDLTKKDKRETKQENPSWFSALTFSPDGGLVAGGFHNGEIRLWDGATEKWQPLRAAGKAHFNWVRRLTFSHDGKTLGAGSQDNSVTLFDVATGKPLATLQHRGPVLGVAFSPDGQLLATHSENAKEGLQVRQRDGDGWRAPIALHKAQASFANAAFSRDGKCLVAGFHDGSVRIWNTADWKQLSAFQAHEPTTPDGPAFAFVSFLVDNGKVLTVGGDGKIKIWDIAKE